MTTIREIEKRRNAGDISISLPLEASLILVEAHEEAEKYEIGSKLREQTIQKAIDKVHMLWPHLFRHTYKE